MPILRKRPTAGDVKIKVLECPDEHGMIGDLLDMTIDDFETGSWRKKLAARNLNLEDIEFLTDILGGVVVREVSEGDEPSANLVWIRETDGSLEIWKTGTK